MAAYTFEYTAIPIVPSEAFPNGQTAYRPLVRARVVAPASGSFLRCLVLADTGADHCIFPLSFASAIGLDQLQMKMQNTTGVGNTGNATYYEDIRIEIPLARGMTLTFTTTAGFTAGMDQLGIGLLGQTGFFETFPTTFNHKARIFTIDV